MTRVKGSSIDDEARDLVEDVAEAEETAWAEISAYLHEMAPCDFQDCGPTCGPTLLP